MTEKTVFQGKTLVVTGKMRGYSRHEINEKIETLGAKARSSVSRRTDYVIAGENAGIKLTKAKQIGIPILTEQEFEKMIQEDL